jgi:hypothetical protein
MMIMQTRQKDHMPQRKGNRLPAATPTRRQPVRHNDTTTERVVVFEAVSAAQNVIRVSIETAVSARLPERVIVF